MTRNIRLKYVKTFEITISFVVLSVDISALLVSPSSTLCLTSSSVSPVIFMLSLSFSSDSCYSPFPSFMINQITTCYALP